MADPICTGPCTGVDPCDGCKTIRQSVFKLAVDETWNAVWKAIEDETRKAVGFPPSREQRDTLYAVYIRGIYNTYAEAFRTAIEAREKLAQTLAQKRLEEKEARDKSRTSLKSSSATGARHASKTSSSTSGKERSSKPHVSKDTSTVEDANRNGAQKDLGIAPGSHVKQ